MKTIDPIPNSAPRPAGALTRRQLLARTAAVGAGLLAVPTALAAVEGAPIVSTQTGETPTTGGLRPGPVGLNPPVRRNRGVRPVAIQIDKAQVDAEVEEIEIVDGVMQNPTGPFVVSWYRETGRLGQSESNVVMAGHVDYWDVGEAVFWYLRELAEGDEINVTGEDGTVYAYGVEWLRDYTVAELTPDQIDEIVGRTEVEALTLITCGGDFDYATGEYLSRMVVRAHRIEEVEGEETEGEGAEAEED